MKTLLFSLFLALCSHADAVCVEVADTCLTKAKLEASVSEFLKLEAKLGRANYDLHHIGQFKVYTGKALQTFEAQNVDQDDLLALGEFATMELKVYDRLEYTAFDILKSAEKVNKKKFIEFLGNTFSDSKEYLESAEGVTAAQKKEFARLQALRGQAINTIATFMFLNDDEATIYELLDNNNENVQDAQFMVVSKNAVIFINKFWWL